MIRKIHVQAMLAVAIASLSLPQLGHASFTAFDSGQVRPMALSPDGNTLFAVNTPDNRLEIFSVSGGSLTHTGSVPVGLEPVAVATRMNGLDLEAWVVNHLSDSVSIVNASASPPQVTRTLLVGDEPRDIVVAAGTVGDRVMITTARRGQNWANHSTDPDPLSIATEIAPLRTGGIGRALVWVFDPDNLGTNLEGNPLQVVRLFGDTPRALAVSNDGNSVFAAVFHSGNQTTTVSEGSVCDTSSFNMNNNNLQPSCTVLGQTRPGGLPLPHDNADGDDRPETGLIVKFHPGSGEWRDELDRDWSSEVRFDLPDLDVFEISTTSGAVLETFSGVGTINFNMVAKPGSTKVYVSNTEAVNRVRFEGPGVYAAGFKPGTEPSTVNGHLHEARITVLDTGGSVTPQHLNTHIDYTTVPSPAGTKDDSLATPTGMVVTSDGMKLYVAAFGSGKVGVYNTTQLENGTFTPSSADHITVGGGPTGLVLDEANSRLYVFNRFDNTISIVDTLTDAELSTVAVYNPEPASITDGRPFLYDANLTSSNGEASCSSCHVFGDLDSLAWDLGNPDDEMTTNNLPLNTVVPDIFGNFGGMEVFRDFHPMKGPMTTQTLRGMANHGALHWRGDRSVGFFGNDTTDEFLSFKNFVVAFPGLVGRATQPTEAEMELFANFMLDVFMPPNPIRSLDNTTHSISGSEAALLNLYNVPATDSGVENCNGCHRLDPSMGFFGADGGRSFENEPQHFKVAQLRNVYQKVGMFGMPDVPFLNGGDNGHKGDQIRGFGMLHDGGIDTVFRFLNAIVFTLNDTQRRDLESFILQFPSDLAPIVGQQTTLTATNAGDVGARIDLLLERAAACHSVQGVAGTTECELIAKGTQDGEDRGWVGVPQGPCISGPTIAFRSDRASETLLLSDAQLRAVAAAGNNITYTCVPPGSGMRMGIDRDEDGFFDQTEEDAGSDPADPASTPGTGSSTVILARKVLIQDKLPNDESKRRIVLISNDAGVTFPAPLTAEDPRCNGSAAGTSKVTLIVSSSTSGESHTIGLPCENWDLRGNAANPKGYKYKDKELDDGTVKVVSWKQGRLRVLLSGKGSSTLDYDLAVGVSQGTVDVLFDNLGTGLCMACVPSNGQDGSNGKKFQGKNCPAPVSCGL